MITAKRYLRTSLLAIGMLIAFWAMPQALDLSNHSSRAIASVEAGSPPQQGQGSAPSTVDPAAGPGTITFNTAPANTVPANSAPNNAGLANPPVQGLVSLDGLSQQQLNQLLGSVLAALQPGPNWRHGRGWTSRPDRGHRRCGPGWGWSDSGDSAHGRDEGLLELEALRQARR